MGKCVNYFFKITFTFLSLILVHLGKHCRRKKKKWLQQPRRGLNSKSRIREKRGVHPFLCVQINVLKDIHNCTALHPMPHWKYFSDFVLHLVCIQKIILDSPPPTPATLSTRRSFRSSQGQIWGKEGTGEVRQRKISSSVFSKPGPWTTSSTWEFRNANP